MAEPKQIEKYSEKLRADQDFIEEILQHLSKKIYLQLKERKAGNEPLFYDESTAKGCLRNLILLCLNYSEFWQQKAKWILSMLEAWKIEKREPFPLPILEDWPKPASLGVKQRESYLIALCAFKTVEEILHNLNASNLSVESLEHLLGLRENVPPPTEGRLPEISPIPSSALMVSSLQAQLRKDLWQQDSNGIAVFYHRCKRNDKNFIEHYITSPGDITLLPWETAEQIIDKFGFETVKLQLLFAAHTMKQKEPWRSIFHLKASDIIQQLGWDKNHRDNLPEKRNQVASIAYALSSLLVKAVWIEGSADKQINASIPTGRMWEVLVEPHGQLNLLTGKIDCPDEVYLTVRPGLWTETFLNRAGRSAKEALYQFGYLALNILKIDPYHDELALRLAIHLTLDSRIRALDKNPYHYRVRSLLEAVLPQTAIEAAIADKCKSHNLKNRWNSALTLLVKLGWQIDFSETYPEWLRPGSEAPKPEGWRKIKIIDRLLAASLTVKPPDPIPQQLASITKPKKSRQLKLAPGRALTGLQIRTAREIRGWSRSQLGGFLNLSADYIGKLERGDRVLTPELEASLKKLLFFQD